MGICSLRGDEKTNAWLNAFIDKISADGRLEAINKNWLNAPTPEFPKVVEGVPFTVK